MFPTEFNSFAELFAFPYAIIPLVASAAIAALLTLASSRFLLIAQQTGYKPDRLSRRYKTSGAGYKNRLMLLSLMSFLSFCLVAACFIPAAGEGASSLVGFSTFILFLALYIKTEAGVAAKLPLKKTGRLIRLSVTLFFVAFVLCLFICFVADSIAFLIKSDILAVLRFSILTFTPMLLPYAVIVSEAINKPSEDFRNARFVKKAKETLKKSSAVKIGITGSFGKTGVKELLKSMLSVSHKVIATPESFNTPLGIALTVKNGADADFFIAEMGAKNKGDIKELCDVVMPSVGVLTGVNSQHLESFGNEETIKKTKFELFENLCGDKIAIFSSDNDGAKELYGKFVGDKYSAGINGTFVRAENVSLSAEGSTFDLCIKGEKPVRIETELLGRHNVSNICLAAAAAYKLGASVGDIKAGAFNSKPVPHRLSTIKAAGGGIIIDDAYNSSEDGAVAALETLSEFGGKKTVITPGLVELGERQELANENLGKLISEVADEVVLVGKTNTDALKKGLSGGRIAEENVKTADTLKAAVELLGGVKDGEVCLFLNDLPDEYD